MTKAPRSGAEISESRLALPLGEVHLWHVDATGLEDEVPQLLGWLTRPERERANSFRFEGDRATYVVSHAMMRRLLMSYLGLHRPGQVRVVEEHGGKPRLSMRHHLRGFRFNLSRDDTVGLLGVGRFGRVGVDVQSGREPAPTVVGKGGLSDDEGLRSWVRREAVVKALGTGLADIERVEVGGDPPVRVAGSRIGRPGLVVHDLALDVAGYAAAVAFSPWATPVHKGAWEPSGCGPEVANGHHGGCAKPTE